MKLIVAVDENWGIGKNNELLFSIPEDMKYFRQKTSGKVVVMGRKTLLSFPNSKPLKNRVNIVYASKGFCCEGAIVVNSDDELKIELAKYPSDDIFIIGGAMFYQKMYKFCDELFITRVFADGKADTFFENLDSNSNFARENLSEKLQSNGIDYQFTVYKNHNILKF